MKEMSQSMGSTLTASTRDDPSQQQALAGVPHLLHVTHQYFVLVTKVGLRVRPLES